MKIKEVYVRWIGIPILALIMVFIIGRDEDTLLKDFLTALVFTTIYWNGAFAIFMHYRKVFPTIRETPKRLAVTLLSLVTLLVVGDMVICLALGLKQWSDLTNFTILFEKTPKSLIASLVVGSIYENVYFFQQWRSSIEVNEALKSQQIRTQFEVLQNQMSPHFLFNSLNTLNTLIAEDQRLAIDFNEKLSDVYRYILQNKEKELVDLESELKFVEDYLFLLKMRYPQNLHVQIEVPVENHHLHIAPLTLQMLVENSIKHNVISRAMPLFISIVAEQQRVVVENNRQPKKVLEKSTKTGLDNIRKRYQFLTKKKIEIIANQDRFSVAIPLLEVVHEKHQVLVS